MIITIAILGLFLMHICTWIAMAKVIRSVKDLESSRFAKDGGIA